MTIKGVTIDDDARDVMLLAGLRVERSIGRRLTAEETDILILAVVNKLAERSRRSVH